jgi:hypothetical protein
MLKLLASTGVGFNVSSDFFGAIVNADDMSFRLQLPQQCAGFSQFAMKIPDMIVDENFTAGLNQL